MTATALPSMTPTGWFQIAWSADVAVADVRPLHYLGRDLVVFRELTGDVKVVKTMGSVPGFWTDILKKRPPGAFPSTFGSALVGGTDTPAPRAGLETDTDDEARPARTPAATLSARRPPRPRATNSRRRSAPSQISRSR